MCDVLRNFCKNQLSMSKGKICVEGTCGVHELRWSCGVEMCR
jgi:hypothetical protein